MRAICRLGGLVRDLPLQRSRHLAGPLSTPVGAPARSFGAAPVAAALVKQLRDRTGASMGKCRDALSEEGGDIDRAVEWLKKRGVRSMEKRTNEVAEALLAIDLAADGSAGAFVELKAETDFVTRSELFQGLCLHLASVATRQQPGVGVDMAELAMGDGPNRPKQLATETLVKQGILELGSVLGEKIVLGDAHCLAATDGGIVGGYIHPKSADDQPGTGRMAALVKVRTSPASAADGVRLREVAATLAKHVVAGQPRFVSVASVPAEVLRKERETMKAAHLEQIGQRKAGTIDEKTLTKVLSGKTQKFYNDNVLLCQELITKAIGDEKSLPVAEWLEKEAAEMGVEAIVVEDMRFAAL